MIAVRRTIVTIVGLVVLAVGASAQPKGLTLKAGDAEKWAFTMDGKSVGTMDATCTAVRTGGDKKPLYDWKYGLKLDLNVQGQQVALAMNGTFTVTGNGNPTALTLNANVNGQAQKLTGTFAGGKAKLSAEGGARSMNQDVAITGKEFLSINNVMTLFSIATRKLQIQPGKTVTAPFFAAEMMRSLDITFKAAPATETIAVAGKKVECVVCDVKPIEARIHISKATGEMVRYAMPAQKLVIERR